MMKRNGVIHTRLLTARETARLMGAPENYWLPEKYNDAYMAKVQRAKEREAQNDDTRAVVGI